MPDKRSADEFQVSVAIRAFESQALAYANRFIPDAKVRSEYISKAQGYSRSTRELYDSGKVTAQQAAEIAHGMRNEVMELARAKTSSMGQSVAIILKDKGIPLEELFIKYAASKFGKAPKQLSAAEMDVVALEIVAAAGRTNATVNTAMRGLGKAGRAFWVLTALVAAYNIGTAKDKAVAAGREGANIAGGMAGGALGGAAVGAAVTGPLAPIGAAVGAIIGGILGAALADEAYVETAVPLTPTVARIVPRFTQMFWRDEEAMASALYDECGINIDQVSEVMEHLNQYYNTDADDVAYSYVELVRKHGGIVEEALKLNNDGKQLLIETLESGWTDSDEQRAIDYLKNL